MRALSACRWGWEDGVEGLEVSFPQIGHAALFGLRYAFTHILTSLRSSPKHEPTRNILAPGYGPHFNLRSGRWTLATLA